MTTFRLGALALAMLAAVACDRSRPASVDSARPQGTPRTDSTVAIAPDRSWDASAGPVLLVNGDAPSQAIVVVPDSANGAATIASLPKPASVTLISRTGSVQTAELPSVTESGACLVGTLSAAPPPRPWSVGFIGGVVTPVTIDSTESIPPADSASLVAGVTRLASALPNDSAGRFAGLPFVVRGMWRFKGSAQTIVVAKLVRQINQEATPLQENTLLVAESAADSTFRTAYSERSYGDEETVESHELLAAALLGANRNVALLIANDFGSSTSYSLVERGDDGRWHRRWTSGRRSCTG